MSFCHELWFFIPISLQPFKQWILPKKSKYEIKVAMWLENLGLWQKLRSLRIYLPIFYFFNIFNIFNILEKLEFHLDYISLISQYSLLLYPVIESLYPVTVFLYPAGILLYPLVVFLYPVSVWVYPEYRGVNRFIR